MHGHVTVLLHLYDSVEKQSLYDYHLIVTLREIIIKIEFNQTFVIR